LTGLLRTHDLGIDTRSPLTTVQIRTVKAWRPALAMLDTQFRENNTTLRILVTEHVPDLLEEPGIGP
jgi:transposase